MKGIGGFYNLFTTVMVVGSMLGYVEHEKASVWSWLQTSDNESARLYQEGRQALGRR